MLLRFAVIHILCHPGIETENNAAARASSTIPSDLHGNRKALKVEFAEWLDSAFPANPRPESKKCFKLTPGVISSFPPRKSYCTSLDVPGPCLLRPFQLAWRADFGLAGSQEPDQLLAIAELVAVESSLIQIVASLT